MEKNFSRVYSAKDITIILTLAVAGTILVVLPTSSSINILGFFMLSAGIILGIFMKTGYKDEETGIRYCKSEHFFASNKREILAEAISGNLRKLNLADEDAGNSLRMDIYYSAKSGKYYRVHFASRENFEDDANNKRYLMVYDEKKGETKEYLLPARFSATFFIHDDVIYFDFDGTNDEVLTFAKIDLMKL